MAEKKVVSRSQFVDAGKVGKTGDAGTTHIYQGTVEAEWQCNSCGRTAIPGSQKICPACQHPKDASEVYQSPSHNSPFLSQTELKERGVDVKLHLSDESCQFCGSKLKPGTTICPNCRAVVQDVGYTNRICPACGHESREANCPRCQTATVAKIAMVTQPVVTPKPLSLPMNWLKPLLANRILLVGIAASLSVFLCLCSLWVGRSFFDTPSVAGVLMGMPAKSQRMTVSQLEWERVVEIEAYQYNSHSDWIVPAGADLLSEEQRVHHYNSVLLGYEQACNWQWQQTGSSQECGYEQSCSSVSVYDHTESICYDDGTCDNEDVYRTEQQCSQEYVCEDVPQYGNVQVCQDVPKYEGQPIYQSWYTYSLWEWVTIQPAKANGTGSERFWPEVVLAENQREKANGRVERCLVRFSNNLPYVLPCEQLNLYPVGSAWDVRHNGVTISQIAQAKQSINR